MMAAMAVGDFTAWVEGFTAAGSTIALRIFAPCSGSEASYHHRFGGVMAIPSFPSTTTATIPTIGITATIPAPAITATIPTLATARRPTPTPDRPGTIAPAPPAIIHLWHTATPCGSTVPALQ